MVQESDVSIYEALNDVGVRKLYRDNLILTTTNSVDDTLKSLDKLADLTSGEGHIFVVADTVETYEKLTQAKHAAPHFDNLTLINGHALGIVQGRDVQMDKLDVVLRESNQVTSRVNLYQVNSFFRLSFSHRLTKRFATVWN